MLFFILAKSCSSTQNWNSYFVYIHKFGWKMLNSVIFKMSKSRETWAFISLHSQIYFRYISIFIGTDQMISQLTWNNAPLVSGKWKLGLHSKWGTHAGFPKLISLKAKAIKTPLGPTHKGQSSFGITAILYTYQAYKTLFGIIKPTYPSVRMTYKARAVSESLYMHWVINFKNDDHAQQKAMVIWRWNNI